MVQLEKYFIGIIILTNSIVSGFGQDSTITYKKSSLCIPNTNVPIYMYDGIFLSYEEFSNVDPGSVKSIEVLKKDFSDCNSKITYCGMVLIKTKDSLNIGLKYIFRKTNKWLLKHPLADFELNDQIINKGDSKSRERLFELTRKQIGKIELVEPVIGGENCTNGLIKIKTK